jgi:hypothetical protein
MRFCLSLTLRYQTPPKTPVRAFLSHYKAYIPITLGRLTGNRGVGGGKGCPQSGRTHLKNIAQKFQNLEDAPRTRKRKRRYTQNSVPTVAIWRPLFRAAVGSAMLNPR